MSSLRIEPTFSHPFEKEKLFTTYFESIKILIKNMLPKDIVHEILKRDKTPLLPLLKVLPIIRCSKIDNKADHFSFVVIGNGKHALGVQRFIADMLCKWIIPGKQLALPGSRSVNFYFPDLGKERFYISEYYITIGEEKNRELIKKNIALFVNQIRLNILSVHHARSIIGKKNLSFDKKSLMIQKALSSFLTPESINMRFDEIKQFIFKTSSEKNLPKINEMLKVLVEKRANLSGTALEEMHKINSLFKDHFTAIRDLSYVSKIINLYQLIGESIEKKIEKFPKKRFIHIKILKAKLIEPKNHLAILISFNLLTDDERFEKKHLLKSVVTILPDVEYVKESIIENRNKNFIKTIYLEVAKKEKKPFLKEEVKRLKESIVQEIEDRIENVINPIFMPYKKNIIEKNSKLLAKQLKYINDIPQVIITYDKQRTHEIIFTVILVRLLKKDSISIKKHFLNANTLLNYIPIEKSQIGILRKRYPKEVNVFKVSLEKSSFYRKNFSLNLQQARYFVSKELKKIIGNFRDYNGGMMGQQKDALDALKRYLPFFGIEKELFLENFFYSIKPVVMQSILDPNILKNLFLLFLKISSFQLKKDEFVLSTISMQKYLIIAIGSSSNSLRENLLSKIEKLGLTPSDLTHSYIERKKIFCIGYILKSQDLEKQSNFYHMVLNILYKWKNFKKKLTFSKR